MAESDRLLSDCTPVKGVPRVQIPLSPPFFPSRLSAFRKISFKAMNPVDIFFKVDTMTAHCPEGWMRAKWADLREGYFPTAAGREN